MRKLFVLAFLCLALVMPGLAQDSFDSQVASIIILQSRHVQRDMGVTVAQRAAMNKYADAHRSELEQYGQALEKAGKGARADESKLLSMFDDLKRHVFAQLTAAQLKRLREISLQALDFGALSDDLVAKRVGLTALQKGQIKATFESGMKKANDIERAAIVKATSGLRGEKPKTPTEKEKIYEEINLRAKSAQTRVEPQVSAIKSATRKEIMGILTVKQKETWHALLGKPFVGSL